MAADITLQESDWEPYDKPIRLTRNLTIEGVTGPLLGDDGSPVVAGPRPVFNANHLQGKVQLGTGIVLTMSNAVLVNAVSGNYNIAPRVDLLAASKSDENGGTLLGIKGVLVMPLCYPAELQIQVALVPRPSWTPGEQSIRLMPNASDCVAVSHADVSLDGGGSGGGGGSVPTVPYERRCWAQIAYMGDLAFMGTGLEGATQKRTNLNYAVNVVDSQYLCAEELSYECTTTLGIVGCMTLRLNGGAPPPPPPRVAAAAPQPLSLVPAPPVAQLGGGGGGGAPMGAVLGGAVGGGVALAVVAAAVVFLRRRRRQGRYAAAAGGKGDAAAPESAQLGQQHPGAGGGEAEPGGAGSSSGGAFGAGGGGSRGLAVIVENGDQDGGDQRELLPGRDSKMRQRGSSARRGSGAAGGGAEGDVRTVLLCDWHNPSPHGTGSGAAGSLRVADSLNFGASTTTTTTTTSTAATGASHNGNQYMANSDGLASGATPPSVASPATSTNVGACTASRSTSSAAASSWRQGSSLTSRQYSIGTAGESFAVLSPTTPTRPDLHMLDGGGGLVTHGSVASASSASSAAAAASSAAGGFEVELLSTVLGKGGFGRVVEGRYRGQLVAVKLILDDSLGAWGFKTSVGTAGSAGAGGITGVSQYHSVEDSGRQAWGNRGQPKGTAADHGTTSHLVEALRAEVEVLGRCAHPNIITLLAACLTPPRLCLVMERMDTSLDKLIFGRPGQLIPLEEVVSIALDVAHGLEYLHPTVVHRDLKPGNVLVNSPGTPHMVAKLSDFGLSRLRDTMAMWTENPEVGTPEYMAPELYAVDNNIVTHKTDVYSFGVLLWAMLSGKRPWEVRRWAGV
ncbi:hypothetical protein GPECTOR_24g193 [Gonium pectorale]|uniref:Protein kinase domain-containing protein n=1 Tax=Gonium pectorale TaxID=33097 RepID=A0A150GGG6_GONPE|nr:hypothetical protein GPECTOR_24g193 [Gonium pectorale]|eukprot:KXZ48904.1 hypothetical protein GPECTOR_24g193 [Gonium pectorale]